VVLIRELAHEVFRLELHDDGIRVMGLAALVRAGVLLSVGVVVGLVMDAAPLPIDAPVAIPRVGDGNFTSSMLILRLGH
jgi:hypothetical protein